MSRAYNTVLKPLDKGFEQLTLEVFFAQTSDNDFPPPEEQE